MSGLILKSYLQIILLVLSCKDTLSKISIDYQSIILKVMNWYPECDIMIDPFFIIPVSGIQNPHLKWNFANIQIKQNQLRDVISKETKCSITFLLNPDSKVLDFLNSILAKSTKKAAIILLTNNTKTDLYASNNLESYLFAQWVPGAS